jgi:hypothetical protein
VKVVCRLIQFYSVQGINKIYEENLTEFSNFADFLFGIFQKVTLVP